MNKPCPNGLFSNGDHLFVYGTLMRRSRRPMRRLLAASARYEGKARIPGRLYDVGAYPAAVPPRRPGEWVWGELYRLLRPAVLDDLDAYEGCGPGERRREYVRVRRAVERADGGTCDAWVYLYDRPVARLRRIVDGDYAAQRRREWR